MRGCRFYVTDAEGMRKAKGHPLSRRGYSDAMRQAQSIDGNVTLSCATIPGAGPEITLALCESRTRKCEQWVSSDQALVLDRDADETIDRVGTHVGPGLGGGGSRARKRQRKAADRDRRVEAAEQAENRRLKTKRR